MPCFDSQTAYQEELARKKREADPIRFAAEHSINAIHNLAANGHKLTDMLCRTLKDIQHEGLYNGVDSDIQQWWEDHKKWDEERKK